MWLLRLGLGRGAHRSEVQTSEQGHCPGSASVWGDAVRLVQWHEDTANWNQRWVTAGVSWCCQGEHRWLRWCWQNKKQTEGASPTFPSQPACSLHLASTWQSLIDSHMPKEEVICKILSNYHKECGAENNNSIMARRKEKINQCACIYILVH